ncbi:hypothetical protein MNB_SUP05-10-928 [hydrothermal vent metagenome]|uniref:Uncharacterized protein n=1 Tax=hydrothermal vent metagenome TaxID=652676 RepID=A0A1W1D624_9ZZZZ
MLEEHQTSPELTAKEMDAFCFVHHRKHLKHWESLYEYYQNSNDIGELRLSILKKICLSPGYFPSDKQALVIYNLYQDAVKAGWNPNEK